MQMQNINDEKIQLTPIEFKLIHLLAKNPNKVFSREYITNLLWPKCSRPESKHRYTSFKFKKKS